MTRRRASAITTLVAAALCALLFLLFQTVELPAPAAVPPGYFKVTQVYDGDTFAVDMNGTTEKVRLIGVDTPETHKPGAPVQCFGPQASDFTKNLVTGQAVRLVADPTNSNRDRYDRLLRYTYLQDGTLLQEKLIIEGFGFAYLSFPFEKSAEFEAKNTQAQTDKKGLWAACTTTFKNGRWQTNDL